MAACQTGDGDELEPAGYYLVSAVRSHNTGRLLTEAEEAKTRELAHAMEFGILQFTEEGKLRSIRDGQLREERLAIQGVTMTVGDSTFKNVRATEFGFIMTITKLINKTPVDFRHRVYQFKLGDNEQRFGLPNSPRRFLRRNTPERKKKSGNECNRRLLFTRSISRPFTIAKWAILSRGPLACPFNISVTELA